MIASPRNRYVIFLDAGLLIIFLLLLSPRLTGLALHELLGFIFFVPILIHLLIAWPWIQKSTKNYFRTATRRTKFNFFLNSILFILINIELVSGFCISQVVLPAAGVKTINDELWRSVHNSCLNFTMLFAALHIAINWDWIVSVFKKRKSLIKMSKRHSPGLVPIVFRIVILVLITGIVASILYFSVGQPSMERSYDHNEVERFKPTVGHGLMQFLFESFLVAIVVLVARRWLKIKL